MPALAITSRHHPVAVSSYVGLTILSVLYLADVAQAPTLADETDAFWIVVWQVSLLLGGILALVGVFAPVKQLKRLLRGLEVEAAGACTLGIELGVYVVVLIASRSPMPWGSVLVFGSVAIGCLCRCYTALRDRRRVIRSAQTPRAAAALAEAEKA